jgi:choline dehydrogenase-like flavoprotein
VIVDGNASGERLHSDVCIIGGGPAAISAALELRKCSAKVLLLVGGGSIHESASDQDLNRGVIARPGSHEGLEENRRRVFGGASSAWGGRCIPFDPVDFKDRPWVPHSGWPFSYESLEGFYRRALALCRAGKYDFDSRTVFPSNDAEIVAGMGNEDLESWHLERWSPPINFAKEYFPELTSDPNITVVLNAHVLRLDSSSDGKTITSVEAISNGTRFEVDAKIFVLATGGIENARILLASQSESHPSGIGNDHDLVGRFYQVHLGGTYTLLAPTDRKNIKHDYERDAEGVYCRRRWWISESAQARLGICNIIFFLDRTNAADGHRDVAFSAVFIAKAALSVAGTPGIAQKWAKLRTLLPAMNSHLAVIAKDGPASIPRFVRLMRARREKRRLPSILPSVDASQFGLYFQAEQTPNPESRITLSKDQVDAHGMPRANVDLKFTDLDMHTIVEAHKIFVERYRAAGAGEIVYDEQGLIDYVHGRYKNFNSAGHYIGTTRMAVSPEQGVVDANSKVFGIHNLYVAGCSVFPTGGHANPTLTICALAIRLGEHLAERFIAEYSEAISAPGQSAAPAS